MPVQKERCQAAVLRAVAAVLRAMAAALVVPAQPRQSLTRIVARWLPEVEAIGPFHLQSHPAPVGGPVQAALGELNLPQHARIVSEAYARRPEDVLHQANGDVRGRALGQKRPLGAHDLVGDRTRGALAIYPEPTREFTRLAPVAESECPQDC
jgi:hypothetical protein